MDIPPAIIFATIIVVLMIIFYIYSLLGGPLPDFNFNILSGSPSQTQFSPFARWGIANNVSNATCQGYQFNIEQYTLDGIYPYISLGTPSLSQLNQGNTSMYTNIPVPFSCIDPDTINAIEQMHTCNRTITATGIQFDYDTDDVKCTRLDGSQASYNETEYFYAYCPNTLYCAGEIGNAAIGYNTTSNIKSELSFSCMYPVSNSLNSNIKLADCNLALSEQQFRVVKADAGKYPLTSSKGFGTGLSGSFVRFQHRDTGWCLYPDSNYDFVSLRDPTGDNTFKGFVWAIIPPITFTQGVICSNKYDAGSKDYADCISSANKKFLQSCYDDCYDTCTSNVESCAAINCGTKSTGTPCGSKPNYDNGKWSYGCSKNSASSCLAYCDNSMCSAETACYSNCTNTAGDGDYYGDDSIPCPQQIIYIGKSPPGTPLPRDPNDLYYKFIVPYDCKSMYRDSNSFVRMGKFQTIIPNTDKPTNLGPYNSIPVDFILFNTLASQYNEALSTAK